MTREEIQNNLWHSAKGQTWKKHKYIGIKNGRHIYPKSEASVGMDLKRNAQNLKGSIQNAANQFSTAAASANIQDPRKVAYKKKRFERELNYAGKKINGTNTKLDDAEDATNDKINEQVNKIAWKCTKKKVKKMIKKGKNGLETILLDMKEK